jgi:hypothetical protein
LCLSFLPFTFYLFAGAIRVALIFVLKSELLACFLRIWRQALFLWYG